VLATVNAKDGTYSIRYQGRTLDRRVEEMRPHVALMAFIAKVMPHM